MFMCRGKKEKLKAFRSEICAVIHHCTRRYNFGTNSAFTLSFTEEKKQEG